MTNKMSKVVFIQYLQTLRVGPRGVIKCLTHTALCFICRWDLSERKCALSACPYIVWTIFN